MQKLKDDLNSLKNGLVLQMLNLVLFLTEANMIAEMND